MLLNIKKATGFKVQTCYIGIQLYKYHDATFHRHTA